MNPLIIHFVRSGEKTAFAKYQWRGTRVQLARHWYPGA